MPKLPFEHENLDPETDAAIKRDFKGYTRGLLRWKPFNVMMPPAYIDYADKIYNMEVRKDDVWVVTFPKTGTTWTQAAIWSILNDGNLELLKENPAANNWRFIDMGALGKDGIDRCIAEKIIPEHCLAKLSMLGGQFEKALNDPSPRLIKSHLPFSFLPPNLEDTAKVVYIARNPRDTCVSYFHHHRLIRVHDYEGDFPLFFDYFIKDLLLQSPYWEHIIEGWNKRNHPNVLFMFYEDMKKDFPGSLRKLGNFLGKTLSDEMVEKLNEELSIEGMKRNPALNAENAKQLGIFKEEGSFIRKGIVGDWKNHFTDDMKKRMDEWSRQKRQGCDIVFPGEGEEDK